MTDYQDALVLENLDLVNWVIRTRISIPNRPLLTYDDFTPLVARLSAERR